jgi:hypothetical protein
VTDEERQNALADVVELARTLHALRGLTGEVERLLSEAMKVAHSEGLSQAIIAEATALSAGRVSQMINHGEISTPRRKLHDRVYSISEWPGDALRPYRASFPGRMTFPPYPRRRASTTIEGLLNGGVEGVQPWDGSGGDATRLVHDLVASGMSSDEATAAVFAAITAYRAAQARDDQ